MFVHSKVAFIATISAICMGCLWVPTQIGWRLRCTFGARQNNVDSSIQLTDRHVSNSTVQYQSTPLTVNDVFVSRNDCGFSELHTCIRIYIYRLYNLLFRLFDKRLSSSIGAKIERITTGA
jgi:hypothetical protein